MKPNVGCIFVHRDILDPFWRPNLKNKEPEADRPPALMRVTSVQKNKVYFTFIDAPKPKVGTYSMSLDMWADEYAAGQVVIR